MSNHFEVKADDDLILDPRDKTGPVLEILTADGSVLTLDVRDPQKISISLANQRAGRPHSYSEPSDVPIENKISTKVAFVRWLNAVRGEFGKLVTGSLILAAMGFAQSVFGLAIPKWCYIIIVVSVFVPWAFFAAWHREHNAHHQAVGQIARLRAEGTSTKPEGQQLLPDSISIPAKSNHELRTEEKKPPTSKNKRTKKATDSPVNCA